MADSNKGKGVWLITTGDGQVIPESAEVKALRKAMATNGRAEFVMYGSALGAPEDQPVTAAQPTPKATVTSVTPEVEQADTAAEDF